MDCSMQGLPVCYQIPEFAKTHVHWVGDAIQPSHPLLSPSPPTFNISQHHSLFKWVSSSHQVAKVLEFQLQYQTFQWIFKTDFLLGWTGWISLLSNGFSSVFSNTTVKNINSSALSCIAQFSHPNMTTGKTIALTIWIFVGKVMSLLFNMLSKLVRTFLPRSKHLLISWLQSPSAVILEHPSKNVCRCFQCFPIYLPWSDGIRCHDISFLNVEF